MPGFDPVVGDPVDVVDRAGRPGPPTSGKPDPGDHVGVQAGRPLRQGHLLGPDRVAGLQVGERVRQQVEDPAGDRGSAAPRDPGERRSPGGVEDLQLRARPLDDATVPAMFARAAQRELGHLQRVAVAPRRERELGPQAGPLVPLGHLVDERLHAAHLAQRPGRREPGRRAWRAPRRGPSGRISARASCVRPSSHRSMTAAGAAMGCAGPPGGERRQHRQRRPEQARPELRRHPGRDAVKGRQLAVAQDPADLAQGERRGSAGDPDPDLRRAEPHAMRATAPASGRPSRPAPPRRALGDTAQDPAGRPAAAPASPRGDPCPGP